MDLESNRQTLGRDITSIGHVKNVYDDGDDGLISL